MTKKEVWTNEPLDLDNLDILEELDDISQSELAEVLKFETGKYNL